MSTRSVLSDQFQYDVEPSDLLGDKVAKTQNRTCLPFGRISTTTTTNALFL